MSDEWQEYVKDPRTVCKYGIKCYQKNPDHHATYKHPPIMKNKRDKHKKHRHSPYSREIKPKGDQDKKAADPNESKKDAANTAAGVDDATMDEDHTVAEKVDSIIDQSEKGGDTVASKKEQDKKSAEDDDDDNSKKDDKTADVVDPEKEQDNKASFVVDPEKNLNENANDSRTCQLVKNTPELKDTKEDTKLSKIAKEGDSEIDTPKITRNKIFHDSSNHDLFEELFLVKMPPDFFKFYELLNDDQNIEKTMKSVNLQLIGPYELLLGKLPVVEDKELYLIHWRFFFDPPEFQAVLKKKGNSEYHMGYYRDIPDEMPVFVASNDCAKDYTIKPMSENIFGAVYLYLQNEKKSSPFTAMACQKIMDKIKKYSEENNFTLEEYDMKLRLPKIVSKTFHGAGIVVPYNKKTLLGYRHLVETDANIKKLFVQFRTATTQEQKDAILSKIQPIITYATIAVDECDFGTGVEAGIDLFCSGLKELEASSLSNLTATYSLLNREAYSKIIQAHLKNRRRGPNVSLLNISED